MGRKRPHVVGQLTDVAIDVGIIGVGHKPLRQAQRRIGKRLGEHLVHLHRNGIGALVGHLWRNGVLLLVGVVDDFRVLRIIGIKRHHVAAKAFGNHHRRIILARLGAIDGVFLIGEYPLDLIVRSKRRNHLLANVDFHGDQIAFIALVNARHGDFQVARIAENIPRGNHVVPRENRWQSDEAQHDDARNHVRAQALQIAHKQLPNLLHRASPPFTPREPSGASSPMSKSSAGPLKPSTGLSYSLSTAPKALANVLEESSIDACASSAP